MRIDLGANGGGIGDGSGLADLRINSSSRRPGRLYAIATDSIHITETEDELYLLAAISTGGLVRLTLPDTIRTRGPPTGAGANTSTEDLVLMTDGKAIVYESDLRTIVKNLGTSPATTAARSGIWASGDISLWVGDDVLAPEGSWIVAGGTIFIHGDVDRSAAAAGANDPDTHGTPAGTNVDTGGTVMTLRRHARRQLQRLLARRRDVPGREIRPS